MPFAAVWMELDSHSVKEVKDKSHPISLTGGIQKKIQMNFFTKQKQTHRHRKQT